MAENPSNIKQKMEMCMAEELAPERQEQSQEPLIKEEMLEGRYSSSDASQWQQILESNSADCAAAQPIWNMIASWPKEVVSQGEEEGGEEGEERAEGVEEEENRRMPQLQIPIISGEPVYEAVHPPEYPGGFQGMRAHFECNREADLIAEIGLEILNGLEMEVMRTQIRMINERLCALEDQVTVWHYKGALLFTMLMSACAVNLWLWMRH